MRTRCFSGVVFSWVCREGWWPTLSLMANEIDRHLRHNEYRIRQHTFKAWMQFWFEIAKRLEAAKPIQQKELTFSKDRYEQGSRFEGWRLQYGMISYQSAVRKQSAKVSSRPTRLVVICRRAETHKTTLQICCFVPRFIGGFTPLSGTAIDYR